VLLLRVPQGAAAALLLQGRRALARRAQWPLLQVPLLAGRTLPGLLLLQAPWACLAALQRCQLLLLL
jgi:hypothetical protein